MAHWEFNNWRNFLSTHEGLIEEFPFEKIEYWAMKIHQKTGGDMDFLMDVLGQYNELHK